MLLTRKDLREVKNFPVNRANTVSICCFVTSGQKISGGNLRERIRAKRAKLRAQRREAREGGDRKEGERRGGGSEGGNEGRERKEAEKEGRRGR